MIRQEGGARNRDERPQNAVPTPRRRVIRAAGAREAVVEAEKFFVCGAFFCFTSSGY
jgi:hypothetical protein